MYGLMLTYLSSVFSPDGTLISASAAPHCGDTTTTTIMMVIIVTIMITITIMIII